MVWVGFWVQVLEVPIGTYSGELHGSRFLRSQLPDPTYRLRSLDRFHVGPDFRAS